MQQLERDLMSSAVLCRSARRHLGQVQEGMVVGSLHVLAHLKRKAALAQLIDHLRALRALAEDCVTVQAAVQPHAPAAELPVAAQLLVESEAAYISPYLPISPDVSPYVSPYISPSCSSSRRPT